MPVIELKKCICGMDMVMRGKDSDIGVCANCDGVQKSEHDDPPKRRTTPADRAFHKAMSALVKEWFPKQDPRPMKGYM